MTYERRNNENEPHRRGDINVVLLSVQQVVLHQYLARNYWLALMKQTKFKAS